MTSGLIDFYVSAATPGGHSSVLGTAFAWGAAVAFLIVGAHSLRLFDFRPHGARDPMWFTPTRLPLIVSLLVAVSEELFFRGFLQSLTAAYGQPVYSIFAINLLFATLHLRGGLTFAMSAGFFGMLASIMTLASASLMPAIVMHVGWNTLMWVARHREDRRLAYVGDAVAP
jgi:membrane protease YdiL (CAAX protease family)